MSRKVPYWVPRKARRSQIDFATVRYHALGAYAKSVYLVLIINQVLSCSPKESNIPITAYPGEENYYLFYDPVIVNI